MNIGNEGGKSVEPQRRFQGLTSAEHQLQKQDWYQAVQRAGLTIRQHPEAPQCGEWYATIAGWEWGPFASPLQALEASLGLLLIRAERESEQAHQVNVTQDQGNVTQA
jgi:hypothetical protein